MIVPLECEYFALRGVALLLQTIEKVRERLNPRAASSPASSRRCTTPGRCTPARCFSECVERLPDEVFHTVINRTIRFPETTVAGEPITTYAPTSVGAAGYRRLARELMDRYATPPAGGEG